MARVGLGRELYEMMVEAIADDQFGRYFIRGSSCRYSFRGELKRIVLSRVFDHNGAIICNVKSTVRKRYYHVRKRSLQCLEITSAR